MPPADNLTPTRLARINAIFSEALERALATRDAFLAETCAGDPALREEVESLLDALERSGAGWDSPPLGVNLAEAVAGTEDYSPERRLGTRVGPYELVRLLAQGGMGAVFEARRVHGEFEQRVAIKFLRRGLDSTLAARRFRHERAILATLNHRNIAALLDGGVSADGQPYFMMEFVEGSPITAWADQRCLSVRDRVQLVRQVCRAVQHAHERLVIHRDLKPGNIFVTTDGTVKLLDFGIAKLLRAEPGDGPVTQGHERAMTLEYASPEQVQGAPVSTASDVYSLGVVMFELLAGARPFDFRGESVAGITRTILECQPTPPSATIAEGAASLRGISPRALARELHGDLDSVTLMALRKEPRRRYGSAESLSRDLERYLDGRPVGAQRDSLWYRTRKLLRRRRLEFASAALLLLSTGVGAFATDRLARLADARYRDGRRLANALVNDVHDAIADLPGATEARARLIRPALEYLDRTAADVGADASLDRELVFAYLRIGDVQGNPTNANLGDVVGARASYGKALAIAERVLRAFPRDEPSLRAVALVLERLADVTAPNGDLREAVAHQRRALAIYEEIAARWPAPEATHTLAVSKGKLGDLLGHPAFRNLGDTAAAMAQYRSAVRLLEESAAVAADPWANRRYQALFFERMGRIAQDGHEAGAAGLLERSLGLRRALAAERPTSVNARRDLAITHFLLCALHLEATRLHAAAAACDASFSIRQRLYRDDPTNAQLVRGMALIHRRLGDVADAQQRGMEAATHYRASQAFYDTLRARGAESGSDSADAGAVHRLGAGLRRAR